LFRLLLFWSPSLSLWHQASFLLLVLGSANKTYPAGNEPQAFDGDLLAQADDVRLPDPEAFTSALVSAPFMGMDTAAIRDEYARRARP
jgi:hypothetical protein